MHRGPHDRAHRSSWQSACLRLLPVALYQPEVVGERVGGVWGEPRRGAVVTE